MKKRKVLSNDNLPMRLPFIQTLTVALAYYLLMWILAVVSVVYQEKVDIFKDKN